jgi:uncharacterized membrane protein YhhN
MTRRVVLLMLPVMSALLALSGQGLGWKLGVPFACGMALVALAEPWRRGRRALWWVVVAFAFSMAGDYFLSTRRGRESYFVYGIAAFLAAHAGYLVYALHRGRVHVHALILLLAGYLTYHFRMMAPAIESPVLGWAVLAYLLVSCVSMAAAVGMRTGAAERWLYVAGIALILFSDTLISLNEFLRMRQWNVLILPTYYLAQILVLHAVLLRRDVRYT